LGDELIADAGERQIYADLLSQAITGELVGMRNYASLVGLMPDNARIRIKGRMLRLVQQRINGDHDDCKEHSNERDPPERSYSVQTADQARIDGRTGCQMARFSAAGIGCSDRGMLFSRVPPARSAASFDQSHCIE
jgi:hypothetical protein